MRGSGGRRREGRPRRVLVLTVLTCVTLITVDYGADRPSDPLRKGVDALFGPAQSALGGAAHTLGSAVGGIHLGSDEDEVATLRRENATLRNRLVVAEDQRQRLAQLSALLRLKDEGSYSVVAAQVVAYGPDGDFDRTVTVDAGSADGVRRDQTVVAGGGLVGRVVRVGPRTAVVAVLDDQDVRVGARLVGSQAVGTVDGTGSGLVFRLGDPQAPLRRGDALVTLASTFAPGSPVGRVTAVSASPDGLTRDATVRPFVDLGRLDLLGVITDGPRTTPRIPVTPSPAPPPASSPTARPGASPSPSR